MNEWVRERERDVELTFKEAMNIASAREDQKTANDTMKNGAWCLVQEAQCYCHYADACLARPSVAWRIRDVCGACVCVCVGAFPSCVFCAAAGGPPLRRRAVVCGRYLTDRNGTRQTRKHKLVSIFTICIKWELPSRVRRAYHPYAVFYYYSTYRL